MNKEKIESVAMDYAGLTDDSKDPYARERGARCIAFMAGARWVMDTLCGLPFDEALHELARYAEQKTDACPGAAEMACRLMKDSLSQPAADHFAGVGKMADNEKGGAL